MADYKTYLASNILTEDKQVTYRLLSRALKVHVNAAKEMLFEFHRQQNGKKPGTIHATYLLSGTKRKVKEPTPTNGKVEKDGEDDYMQSSPFVGSSMPQLDEDTGESSVLSITLVKEEDLETVRSQYEHISSIHIYSLGPHPLKDLQMLSDVSREIQELCKSEDPLEFAAKYGTITNKNVKRRTGRRPPPPSTSSGPAKAPPNKVKVEIKEPTKAVKQEKETKSAQPSTAKDFFGKGKEKTKPKSTDSGGSATSSKESTPAPAAAPPALKRDSSSIFKSFAKAKPKLKREGTDSSAIESPAEDSPMRDVDDDDDEEDTYVPPPQKAREEKGEGESDRQSRKAREAALKAMMEDSDGEEEVKVGKRPEVEENEVEVETPDVEMKDETPPAPVVSDGRRRGRRRVMKKKTVKDEDGYLVTKEEPVWESFSEDEPVEKPKPKTQTSSMAAKSKKGAAKAGQGNIMSFFGKK